MSVKGTPKRYFWGIGIATWLRNGGPMKHKNSPRGGARNDSRDLIDEGLEELEEEKESHGQRDQPGDG